MVENKEIKVKHPLLDTYGKTISHTKVNNIILVLCICIILSSSFVIYFFLCMSFEKISYFIKNLRNLLKACIQQTLNRKDIFRHIS